MRKVPTATCALRDRYIVAIEGVYTPSTFYRKSAVSDYSCCVVETPHYSLTLHTTSRHPSAQGTSKTYFFFVVELKKSFSLSLPPHTEL